MEAKIVTKFLADLVNATSDCVHVISNQCLANGLIRRSTYDRVLESGGTGKDKAGMLILAVQKSTEAESSCFDILLEILNEILPPTSKEKLFLEMRKERASLCSKPLAPAHFELIRAVESEDVPLSVANLQYVQEQNVLLGRFENSVSRLAYTSAQKNQFEEKLQNRVEEIGGLKNKLEVLKSQLEADPLAANEKEISRKKSRISACEMEVGDLKEKIKELEDIIEKEGMQVKQDQNTIRIWTKRLLDQVVQQTQQEFMERKEQVDKKARELELKLQELKELKFKEIEPNNAATMGQSYPPSESMPAQKVAVQQSSVPSVEPSPSLSRPTLRDLLIELYSRADKWDSIGNLLDIDPNLLSEVKAEYDTNAGSCLREMLRIWLKRVSPPPSWAAMIGAVEQLDESTFATELRIKYLSNN